MKPRSWQDGSITALATKVRRRHSCLPSHNLQTVILAVFLYKSTSYLSPKIYVDISYNTNHLRTIFDNFRSFSSNYELISLLQITLARIYFNQGFAYQLISAWQIPWLCCFNALYIKKI